MNLVFGDPRIESRFWDKVKRPQGTDDCWAWLAGKANGYGMYRSRSAYRFAYRILVGSIPTGLVLDHLCRNRACVRPDHLEPVTQRENIRRGVGHAARNAVATQCIHGHQLAGSNVYITPNGRRNCRTCRAAATRAYNRRRAA